MAHGIGKTDNMAYVGQTPWHGLGVKLETPPATTEEAILAADMGWTVRKERLSFEFNGQKVDTDQFGVVRETDGKFMGICKEGYNPIQNRKAFENFDPFLQAGTATIETVGSLFDGKRVWMLAKANLADSVIVPQADDRVAKYLLLASSHDGSLAWSMLPTAIRVVCNNTLSMAMGGRKAIKVRHTKNADANLANVRHIIEQIDADFEKTADAYRHLAGKTMTAAMMKDYINAVYRPAKEAAEVVNVKPRGIDAVAFMANLRNEAQGAEIVEEILEAKAERKSRVYDEIMAIFENGIGLTDDGVRGTAWAAVNAIAEYGTYAAGRTQSNRLNSLWFGQGQTINDRALEEALKL